MRIPLSSGRASGSRPDLAPQSTGASVRSRVLAGILAMVLVTVSATGVFLYYLLHRDMMGRIDESLIRTAREFAQRAEDPRSSKTGASFTSNVDFLYDVMQTNVAAPHEGFVATVDGTLRWTAPEHVTLRLESDREFLSWAITRNISGDVYLRSVTTAAGSYRTVILPAAVAGDSSDGRYIVAFDTSEEKADLNAIFLPYMWLSIAALILASVIAWFITGRLLRPLRALHDTAQGISESDLTQRIDVQAKGDLADLTNTFNSMLDRVQGAFEANKQLLDDVGHELRTPITIIRGYVELMDPRKPEDVTETRAVALDELDRMADLVNDLIMLAKADQTGSLRLETVPLDDFAEVVSSRAQGLSHRDWRVDAHSAALVRIDESKLLQAALQLCENAAKFSSEESPVVIGTARADAQWAILSVTDTGMGVPSADLERIFERFNRASNARSTPGSGLGLAIAKTIVQAHSGTISVDSTEGVGTTFSIALPIIDPPHREDLSTSVDTPTLSEDSE